MKMAQNRLSAQDRKDLDKYTKYLAFKAVQLIVQARLGQKIKTKSKPHSSGSDWFNLSIRDIPEVLDEAKRSMAGQIPVVGLGMVVEISLKAVDGRTMVLESWYLEMDEQCDASARVTYTVYSRMSLLLKSLIAVTRVTPGYKMAAMQGGESFVVCYRVFMGEPQAYTVEDRCETVKVGQVGTPIGTLVLSVTYRTNHALTPTKGISNDSPFMVKSDHFKPDMSPKHAPRPSHMAFQQEYRSVVAELAAACQDIHPATNMPQIPFMQGDGKPLSNRAKDNDNSPTRASNQQVSFSERRIVGAFAMPSQIEAPDPSRFFMPEVMFAALLPKGYDDTANFDSLNQNRSNNNLVSHNNNNNNCNTPVPNAVEDANSQSVASGAETQKSSSSASDTDDFVLVDVKPPFAVANEGSPSDLGAFYRECQTAPTLATFGEQPVLGDQIDDLVHQIANFESSMPEFDEFVKSLKQDDTTN